MPALTVTIATPPVNLIISPKDAALIVAALKHYNPGLVSEIERSADLINLFTPEK